MRLRPEHRVACDGCGRVCIPSGSKAKVDDLPIGINRTPEVAPLPADPDVCLVHMPIDAGPAQMLLGAFCQLWSKLDHAEMHRKPVDLLP